MTPIVYGTHHTSVSAVKTIAAAASAQRAQSRRSGCLVSRALCARRGTTACRRARGGSRAFRASSVCRVRRQQQQPRACCARGHAAFSCEALLPRVRGGCRCSTCYIGAEYRLLFVARCLHVICHVTLNVRLSGRGYPSADRPGSVAAAPPQVAAEETRGSLEPLELDAPLGGAPGYNDFHVILYTHTSRCSAHTQRPR